MSAEMCGCDAEVQWTCERHQKARAGQAALADRARVLDEAATTRLPDKATILASESVCCTRASLSAAQEIAAAQQAQRTGGPGSVRRFASGATRDTEEGKLDYEGFLSPLVLERYAQYMHQHRIQSDGSLRDADNWQKGIPQSAYMKSAWRHFMDCWIRHRSPVLLAQEAFEESLCALLFNIMGYLHEILKRGSHESH